MSARVSRRGFLQATVASAAAGSIVLPHGEAHAFRVGGTFEALAPEREVPSFCELCFWNCGLLARVRGNRVLALRGNPDHPNARGKLCGRGQAGAAFLTDGDRLKYPQIRTGVRGAGRFRRAGWKEAYRVIAEGAARIKARHGAQALALFYHGCGGPFMRSLLVAYGSPNFAGPSYSQCKAARNVGYALTFGEKIPSPEPLDFEATRCMVLFGSHLGENAHNGQVQEFVRARARGAGVAARAELPLRRRVAGVAAERQHAALAHAGDHAAVPEAELAEGRHLALGRQRLGHAQDLEGVRVGRTAGHGTGGRHTARRLQELPPG